MSADGRVAPPRLNCLFFTAPEADAERPMKVPLSWLREYVDVTLPVGELARRLTLAGLEKEAIRRALEETGGHRARTAETLGISVRTLQRKIQDYNLES